MRGFISACSAAITVLGAASTVLGAVLLIFGILSFLIGREMSGSFLSIVLVGSGLSTVLLGGTTYMLCNIDERLEGKFGILPKKGDYSENSSLSASQIAKKYSLEAKDEVLINEDKLKAIELPPIGATTNSGWFFQSSNSIPFYFGGGTVLKEMHQRSAMISPNLPAAGRRAVYGFYQLQNGDCIWHDGGTISAYTLLSGL
jgi:hypothetical protein